jgi:ribosome recycling factor
MIDEFLQDAEHRMKGAVASLDVDLGALRTGRASTKLVDRLLVEMYGVETPLNQMASISVPEPQQLAIRPYDANAISAVERAIMTSDIGIMPNSDGKIIRLNMPRLTEDRRRDLRKRMGKRVEEAKVAVRNVRRDVLHDIRDMKNEKIITDDDAFAGQEDLQKLTDLYIKTIETLGEQKEAEIMEV